MTLLLPLALAALAAPAPAPDALLLPRPEGGEWHGLYLVNQKAGWAFSSLEEAPFEGKPAVKATSRFALRASVGGREVERIAGEVRWYERKDGGRLLGIDAVRRGDGGDRTVTGRCPNAGPCRFRIAEDGQVTERTVPHPGERLEDAEAVRLAAARGRGRTTTTFDVDAFAVRKGKVWVAGEERALAGGVKLRVVRVVTEEEDGIRVEALVDPATGRTLSLDAGALAFRAEPEASARARGEAADVFALTRVPLPSRLPEGAREATLVVEGLPEELQLPSPRQRFEALPGGRVRIRLRAHQPRATAELPVDRQAFAPFLAATPSIDADAPAIRARAAALAQGDDVRADVRRMAAWVHGALEKGYGTSSDRASRVLAAGRGDCTEHSLLFVALARAAGIPARTVHGLVAAELGDTPALYWHQWAQVWVGEWLDVDPTFGQEVADATHLALGQEGSTKALSVMGRLRVHEAAGR